MSKRKVLVTISIVIVILAGIYLYVFNETTYTASDVLENVNFSAENPSVSIHSIDYDKEGLITEIKIPKETQQELIKAFKNAKFKKITDLPSLDYDYRIKITLNTGYAMFLDSEKKSLFITDTDEAYTMENDNDFFGILSKLK
ncbi:hypothetical protein WAX74_15020 [Psychrobacillus sp. FJAT-51614]|uniref:Lipoprotein n=1 Tax=Psychrobacillus mangrovi TaxID=3117745 RepID=A0ABU8F7F6_9BACI